MNKADKSFMESLYYPPIRQFSSGLVTYIGKTLSFFIFIDAMIV